MKYYKKIDGKNIYLASIQLEDAESYLQMKTATDNLSRVVFDTYKEEAYDLENAKNELNDLAAKNAFAIISKDTDEMIGLIGLSNTLAMNQRSDMWIKMYTNLDYEKQVCNGTEAVNLLLAYCYQVMNLHSVVATTPSFNTQAMDIYNRSSLVYYGYRSESERYIDKKFYPTVYYQCTPRIFRDTSLYRMIDCSRFHGRELHISNDDEKNMSSLLVGGRICLSKYEGQEEYIPVLSSYLNNPAVSIPIGEYKTNWNNYRAQKQLQDIDYMILKDEKLLGYINLFRKDYKNRTADLEILIGDVNEHNKGYGKEALELYLREQYQNGPFNNILSCVFGFNHPSMSLHRSLGYQPIGIREEGYFAYGKLQDMHLYEMTSDIHKQKVK